MENSETNLINTFLYTGQGLFPCKHFPDAGNVGDSNRLTLIVEILALKWSLAGVLCLCI